MPDSKTSSELKQYDWRSYQTPTKTTVKVLEDLVADASPPQSKHGSGSNSNHSSNSNSNSTDSFVILEANHRTNAGSTPPLSSLPLYPPTSHPQSQPQHETEPGTAAPPPPRTPPHPHPHPSTPTSPSPSKIAEDDVTSTPDGSSKSHRSKESFSSGLPRRLMDELKHLHDRKDANSNTNTTTSSQTDSHPGRQYQHRDHHHHHSTRGGAGPGHGRSRSSSESLSSLLLVTTERLSRETARANDAERKANEVMSLFKNTHEARTKLERDLNRVRQELEMYKIQLDVAQKEIFRAQEIVDRVERERTTAKEEAARARDKIHKLEEARAVEHALEEGRRLGFEEGLRQGRYAQSVAAKEAYQDAPRTQRQTKDDADRVSRYTYPDQESNGSGSSGEARRHRRRSSRPPPQSERSTSKAPPPRTETVASTQRTRTTHAPQPQLQPQPHPHQAPLHRHGTPPDVGSFGKLLPRPTITTPTPLPVPSTQPQPPPAMPPHQLPSTIHDHSSHHPEQIAVQPPPPQDRNGPIHPIPVWNKSPSVMHERITLPPDNFIPTMDANSMISLPPPHELSRPVAPTGGPPPQNNPPPPDYASYRPRSRSRGPEKPRSLRLVDHDDRETVKTKDYAYAYSHSHAPREKEPERYRERDDASSFNYSTFSGGRGDQQDKPRKYAAMRSRATSAGVLSPGSTHLSDLDLLSPPRDDSVRGRRREEYRDEPSTPTPMYRRNPHIDTPSPTQRMAEEWRSANREFLTPPSQNSEPKPQPPVRPTSAELYSHPRPPRRPREIVMPAPLADVFMNTTKSPRRDERTLSPPRPRPRTTSTNTVPGIEVVTPSTHASSRLSAGTVLDPVLLTPESANRPQPLPDTTSSSVNETPNPEPRSMLLQNNNFPEGFVPLSPIPGMANLNPYPAGFAPSLPKDGHDSMGRDYKYPSSPLMRSN